MINARRIGKLPYIGVGWLWAESVVGSRGVAKVALRAMRPTRSLLMQCSCGGNRLKGVV
jgi:hypothetical protein